MESPQSPLNNQELQREIELFTTTIDKLIDIEENINFFTIYLAEHQDPGGIIRLALLITSQRRNHLLDLLAYLTPWITRITNQMDATNVLTQQP